MIFTLSHAQARRRAVEAVANAPDGYVVKVTEPTRSLEQNALLWPLLHDVSKQVEWYGQYLTEEEWKDMFTASLKGQKAVPAIDGPKFVVVGGSTSKMGKKEFSDLIELIYAFGAEHEVKWRDNKS